MFRPTGSCTLAFTPRKLFRIFAIAEMITWAGLVAALISRAFEIADFVSTAGGLHGFVFLSYVTVTAFIWINQKWSTSVGLLGIFLSAIPFATVPYEIYLDKHKPLQGDWRLASGGDHPTTLPERIQAWVLRHTPVAVTLLLALIIFVYVALLLMGPPIPKH